jgi:signal transduction histidine kinase
MAVREALANATWHGSADRIDIAIRFTDHDLTIKIRDDGCGFDPQVQHSAEGKHYGLIGMRERMQRLQGELHISSAPGKGTEIVLKVPRKQQVAERTSLDV